MTRVEDRLAELLRTTVPASRGVALEDVKRRVRHRRAIGWSLAAAVVTTAAVMVPGIAGTSGGGHPNQPFTVTGGATVNVTSSAGVTVSGVLRMTGGPAGASQPGVPGLVRFDEVATGQQYATTAASDGSFALTIPPGEYTATGTSAQFNEGSQPCRADDNVLVTGSGLSSVMIACSRK